MKAVGFVEHPEGGRFREVFRSGRMVTAPGGGARTALTHIYFELGEGACSHFHRVASEEVWNLYEGAGLTLYIWDGSSPTVETILLSAEVRQFCHVVPAGWWQAAEPLSSTVLVGCSVAPGFEFEDFEMMAADSEAAQQLKRIASDLMHLLAVP